MTPQSPHRRPQAGLLALAKSLLRAVTRCAPRSHLAALAALGSHNRSHCRTRYLRRPILFAVVSALLAVGLCRPSRGQAAAAGSAAAQKPAASSGGKAASAMGAAPEPVPVPSVPAEERDAFLERVASIHTGGVPRQVIALYYPWYATGQRSGRWAHQDAVDVADKSIGSHTHYPGLGPYDSTDPAVIDAHLAEAHAAGIDVLLCSWWGQRDLTDKAIGLLLKRAPAHAMKICIYWERLSPPADRRAAAGDLEYLIKTFTSQPGYFRVGSRPVVFLYRENCGSLPADTWAWVLNVLNGCYTPGVLAIGAGASQTDTLLWDGLYSLDGALEMAGQPVPRAAGIAQRQSLFTSVSERRAGRIATATVIPGFDDRKIRAATKQAGVTFVDRQDGKLYSALWERALADKPDWVLINSFNQWHNGTEIEPSAELGALYLKLTRQYASRFKSAK